MDVQVNGESTAEERQPTVRPVRLEEIDKPGQLARDLLHGGMELVQDVKVRLVVSVGVAQLPVGELLSMKEGALLKLDKATSDPVDVFLDGKLVARGELMAAGDQFAIRITEIAARS